MVCNASDRENVEKDFKYRQKHFDYCKVMPMKKNNKFAGFIWARTDLLGKVTEHKRMLGDGTFRKFYTGTVSEECIDNVNLELKRLLKEYKKLGYTPFKHSMGYHERLKVKK